MGKTTLMRKILLAILALLMMGAYLKAQDTITEITVKRIYISQHPQDPEFPQFVIYSKSNNFQLGFGGYVKLTGAFDFNGIVDNYDFITYDIPVGDVDLNEKRLYLDAHQSRIYGEILGHIKGTPLRIYIETDFYSDHYHPRLRHAYGQIGSFLIGQTWSTLMDLDATPNTIDFEGPNSAVALRAPMIRYEYKSHKGFRMQVAAEMPEVSMTYWGNRAQESNQYIPDLIINFRGGGDTAHIQLGGVFRTMSYKDSLLNEQKAVFGIGAVLSTSFKFTKSSILFFQAAGGKGMAKYIQDLAGVGYDAAPVWSKYDYDLHAIPCWGGYIAYQQYWHRKVNSTFTYSYVGVNNNDRQGEGYPYYKAGHYIAGNIFYEISKQFIIALEYLWGKRINEGGNSGNANRINAMAQFTF